MLLLEVARQGCVLILHAFHAVPANQHFIFQSIDMQLSPPETRRISDTPGRLLIESAVTDSHQHKGALAALTFAADLRLEGQHCARMTGSVRLAPPGSYQAMRNWQRARRIPPEQRRRLALQPLPPAAVGRTNPQNVVITDLSGNDGSSLRSEVLIDLHHPSLFDHRLDHLPGSLLLEAHRQAAVTAAARWCSTSPQCVSISRLQATFSDFGEPELPTICEVRVDDNAAEVSSCSRVIVSSRILQATRSISSSTAELKLSSD